MGDESKNQVGADHLQLDKLDQEIAELKARNRELAKPLYRRMDFLLVALPLLVTSVGGFASYLLGNQDRRTIDRLEAANSTLKQQLGEEQEMAEAFQHELSCQRAGSALQNMSYVAFGMGRAFVDVELPDLIRVMRESGASVSTQDLAILEGLSVNWPYEIWLENSAYTIDNQFPAVVDGAMIDVPATLGQIEGYHVTFSEWVTVTLQDLIMFAREDLASEDNFGYNEVAQFFDRRISEARILPMEFDANLGTQLTVEDLENLATFSNLGSIEQRSLAGRGIQEILRHFHAHEAAKAGFDRIVDSWWLSCPRG